MKIDKRLNLVIPFEVDGKNYYAHSMPISREVFERYYLVIAKTFAEVYAQGLHVLSGPQIIKLILRDIAKERGQWEGTEGVEIGLMSEIRRLTNIIVPTDQGWRTLPFQDVINRGIMSEDDLAELEGAIIFFIVNSAMHKRTTLPSILAGMTHLWDAQVTLSSVSEFANSLPKSIATDNFGEMAIISSVPS